MKKAECLVRYEEQNSYAIGRVSRPWQGMDVSCIDAQKTKIKISIRCILQEGAEPEGEAQDQGWVLLHPSSTHVSLLMGPFLCRTSTSVYRC